MLLSNWAKKLRSPQWNLIRNSCHYFKTWQPWKNLTFWSIHVYIFSFANKNIIYFHFEYSEKNFNIHVFCLSSINNLTHNMITNHEAKLTVKYQIFSDLAYHVINLLSYIFVMHVSITYYVYKKTTSCTAKAVWIFEYIRYSQQHSNSLIGIPWQHDFSIQ